MLNGKKLQMLRIYKGKKASDLAKYIGKTKPYVSMLENEKQAIPKEIYEKWLEWLNKVDKSNTTEEVEEEEETK